MLNVNFRSILWIVVIKVRCFCFWKVLLGIFWCCVIVVYCMSLFIIWNDICGIIFWLLWIKKVYEVFFVRWVNCVVNKGVEGGIFYVYNYCYLMCSGIYLGNVKFE